MSIKDLAQALNCNTQIIKDSIEGLIYNKNFNPELERDKGVLISTIANSKNLDDKDEFKINLNFSIAKRKFITLPIKILKKNCKEFVDDGDNKFEDFMRKNRDNFVQSTIIRIIKSKPDGLTSHDWLIDEVSKQIDNFVAVPDMINNNIENLIKNNILNRSEKNEQKYYELKK